MFLRQPAFADFVLPFRDQAETILKNIVNSVYYEIGTTYAVNTARNYSLTGPYRARQRHDP